jgi:membrane-bound serine protease (ClpP class)
MLTRFRPLSALALLSGVLLLTGCAGPLIAEDPTGVALVDRFLAFLANPNVTYLLLVLGLLAIIAEVATPGAVVPGVVGAIMLLLSLFGLLQLPTNWFGVLLILSGVVMMLIDIHAPGIALTIGGIIIFLIGSVLLFARPWSGQPAPATVPQLNPALIAGTTAAVGLFFIFGVGAALKAQRRPIAAGREALMGKVGVVKQPLEPVGIVQVEGEQWSAESLSGERIAEGERVHIVGMDGLKLQVEPEATFERWSRRGTPPTDSPQL